MAFMTKRLVPAAALGATAVMLSMIGQADANAPTSTSVLIQNLSPSSDFSASPPGAAMFNDAFSNDEAGTCPADAAVYCQLSSLDDTFTGSAATSDPALRQSFRDAIAPYINPYAVSYSDPGCTSTALPASGFQLFSHTKPYQIHQATFMSLYKQYSGKADFMPAAARKMNPYVGDGKCPLTPSFNSAALPQTLGNLIYFGRNNLTLMTDNRFNPWRWIAPINEIHHHEQPSLSFLMNATTAGKAATAAAFASALNGDTTQRVLLTYDINITVNDYRQAMNEYSFADLTPANSGDADLLTVTRKNVSTLAKQFGPSNLEAAQVQKYFQTRFYAPTINVSIPLIFQQSNGIWHDIEFLIAGKNYLPSYTGSFTPVTNPFWQKYVPEGGNNGVVAWHRMRIDGLNSNLVHSVQPDLTPIKAGGSYFAIPDGNSTQHLTGTIDLTDWYRFAFATKTLPGTSGVWNGVPKSSIDPTTGKLAANEQHEVDAVGIIYEVHGPFAIKVQLNQMDVQVVAGLQSGAAMASTPPALQGNIDGVQDIQGTSYVSGWACYTGSTQPVEVVASTGQAFPAGHYLGATQANSWSEPAVGKTCQDPLSAPHRFQIALTGPNFAGQQGQPFYVTAISADGRSRFQVSGSGLYSVPNTQSMAAAGSQTPQGVVTGAERLSTAPQMSQGIAAGAERLATAPQSSQSIASSGEAVFTNTTVAGNRVFRDTSVGRGAIAALGQSPDEGANGSHHHQPIEVGREQHRRVL